MYPSQFLFNSRPHYLNMLRFIFIAIFALTHAHGLDLDYYWRDYTGQIPRDAITGGQSSSGGNIYVGQAYIKEGGEQGGIIVVEIRPGGATEVSVPYFGVKKSRFGLKILCSTSARKLSWMRSDSTQLHLDLIGKHAVIGGVENGIVLYVCRVFHNGETRIGKLGSFAADKSTCYFVSGDDQPAAQSFEVLIFNQNTTKVVLDDPNIISEIWPFKS